MNLNNRERSKMQFWCKLMFFVVIVILKIGGETYAENVKETESVFTIYEDDGGSGTEPTESVTVPDVVDTQAPVVTKTENNFKWVLTMQDEVSGLGKITDSTGEIILKDYKTDGYPKTKQTFTVPWKYDKVLVYDAAGNYTQVNTYAHEVGELGYSCIEDPVWSGDYRVSTTYNKVYFGSGSSISTHFDGLFRVLNKTANDDDSTPALFLLSESATKKISDSNKKWDGKSNNIWSSSNIVKPYLQTNSSGNIYYDCFSDSEREVIMDTQKTEVGDDKWYFNGDTQNPQFEYAKATGLNKEKIFLLSAKEVIDTKYGFSNIPYPGRDEGMGDSGYIYYNKTYSLNETNFNGDQSRIAKQGGTNTNWWLRSAYTGSSGYVAIINSEGNSDSDSVGSTTPAVRFALNIPLSKVITASNAAGSSLSTTFTRPTPISTSYKLTIHSNSSFRVLEDNLRALPGEAITVNFAGATIGGSYSIKAIIKKTDDDGITTAYIARGDVRYETATFIIPSDIEPGMYKMVVYNEYNAGENKTNTAGLDTLNLRILPKYESNIFGTEGVCTIHRPKRNTNNASDETTPSTYDYVYFGNLDAKKQYNIKNTPSPISFVDSDKTNYIKTGPLKFRVLDTTSNDSTSYIPASNGYKAGLFLLTEYPIGYRRFDTGDTDAQKWDSSEMRSFLNGEADGCVYKDCFNEVERSAIRQTTKTDRCTYWNSSSSSNNKYYSRTASGSDTSVIPPNNVYCKLNNDKIFLLSTEEVINTRYGFSVSTTSSDINRKVDELHTGGMYSSYWWLRSAFSGGNNYICDLTNAGYPNYTSSGGTYAVRFALNIPLDKVLMTSDASIEDMSTISLVKDRPLCESSEFKLTILDNRTDSPRVSFKATSVSPAPASGENSSDNPIIMSHGGDTITIGYQGAVTGENEYISAVIRRTSDDYELFEGGNYYGVIKKIYKETDASGTVELIIPEGIPQGKYKVMILNEQKNGAYCTNYANKFNIYIEIENTQADTTKPTVIGNVYRNVHNTGFLVEAKDDGILQHIRYGNGLDLVELKGQSCKKNFMAYTAINQFDICDKEGVYTTVQSASCLVDTEAPSVTKEEENFQWKITVQDKVSGLWKITDATGEIILKDYSDVGYPTTQEEFIVPWKYNGVRVYDAVGNYTPVKTYSYQVGTLGYSSIVNPRWSGTYTEATVYNMVHFGFKEDNNNYTDKSKAILFRVLNTTANDDYDTPALFLLSEYTTNDYKQWDDRGTINIWNSSNILKPYLQPDTKFNILYDCFSEKEKGVIMNTKKTEVGDVKWYLTGVSSNPKFWCAGATDINEEKLFLLSAKEVIDTKYGFSNEPYDQKRLDGTDGSGYIYAERTDQSRLAKRGGSGGSNVIWWLRSGCSYNRSYVASVDATGYPRYINCTYYDSSTSDNSCYLRFALNVPLSKVLFTQDATITSPSPTSTVFTTIEPTTNPYKLTIVDQDSDFAITEDNIIANSGDSITLHYSNAIIDEGYSIKAILKSTDDNGITKGYAALGEISDDTVSFTLPVNIPSGKYKIVVYNEYNAGTYKTNTAGYDIVNLTVIMTLPAKNVLGTEGICNIHAPKRNTSDDSNGTIPSTYDYVYFGKLDGTKKYNLNIAPTPVSTEPSYLTSYVKTDPLKFRVLDTTSNDESTPALFLLTEYPIGYRRFDTGSSDAQKWDASEMKSFLNGEVDGCVYKDCFNEVERTVIQNTTKRNDKCTMWNGYYSRTKSGTDKSALPPNGDVYCKLTNDKIFLLSTEEVLNKRYGFSIIHNGSDINRKVDEAHTGGMYSCWWLRSANSANNTQVTCVTYSGGTGYDSSSVTYAVRFALNIPLDKVLMASDARLEDMSTISLVKDRPLSGSSEFKLTILDNGTNSPRASFAAASFSPAPASGTNSSNNPIVMSHGGEIMTIGYQKAATGDNEYISAIIRRTGDGYQEFQGGNYYGVLKNLKRSTDADGTVKLTIPDGIPEGKYIVMILNEQKNGAYCTNYAKKFNIYIEIKNTQEDQARPFVVGEAYRNEANTGFLIKTKDNGMMESIRCGDEILVQMQGQVEKNNFVTSTAISQFDVYNKAGLHTAVQSSSCVVDKEAPIVIKEEENFKWKLTMQDEVSGLWKITDSNGDIIKDYSVLGYPTTQETFIVPWKYNSVLVYDAVGNITSVNTYAHEVGTLGYSSIVNPIWSGDCNTESKYDKVYFGYGSSMSSYFKDTSRSMLFKVLNTTANDNDSTPSLLLLTNFLMGVKQYYDSRGIVNIWDSSCTLKPYLQNIYSGCFSTAEQAVILDTQKTEVGDEKWYYNAGNPRYWYAGATDLNKEKLFALSAKEVIDTKYGFSNIAYPGRLEGTNSGEVFRPDKNRVCYPTQSPSASPTVTGTSQHWWLRSGCSSSSSNVAYVTDSGYGYYTSSSTSTSSRYVRFALNVPLSKVLYTSSASSSSTIPDTTTFTPITPISDPYKLTIVDSTNSFTIAENNIMVAQGGTITLNYTGSSQSGIRAIIKYTDNSGITRGYAAQGSISGSTVSFTVPTSVPTGRYRMVVYNESNAGIYKTNTAWYDTVNLTVVASEVDTTAPEVVSTYVNEDGTYYKVTVKDDMGLSQLVSGSTVKDISYFTKVGTTNIQTTANTAVDVYDIENNCARATDSEIIYVDKTPPNYTITYDKGDYVIHISDAESGIWKITDYTGREILKDWSR